jgi:hypothetical protein
VAYRRQRVNEVATVEDKDRWEATAAHDRTRVFNERLTAIATQLGDDQPAVRLAGVHAMAGLADDWEENRQTCVDVLCACLRLPYDPDPGEDAAPPERAAYRANREVRHTVIRLIGAHLRPGHVASWGDLDFDFTSVIFDGGDFSGARFSGGIVRFDGASFSGGEVSFDGAEFTGGTVSFRGAEFSGGKVSFSEAKFFGGKIYFGGEIFGPGAVFSGGEVDFDGAVFSGGWVSFNGTGFSGSRISFFHAFCGLRRSTAAVLRRLQMDGTGFSGGEVRSAKPGSGQHCRLRRRRVRRRSPSGRNFLPAARSFRWRRSPAVRSVSAATCSPAACSASVPWRVVPAAGVRFRPGHPPPEVSCRRTRSTPAGLDTDTTG